MITILESSENISFIAESSTGLHCIRDLELSCGQWEVIGGFSSTLRYGVIWSEESFWEELDGYKMETNLAGEKQIVFK